MNDITINITENGLLLNGTSITLPCDISELSAVLGEPCKTSFSSIENDLFDEETLEELNEQAANSACYTWNELGIHCHTDDGATVNTISLRMRNSTIAKHLDYYSAMMFSGTLMINGKPWVKQLETGDKGFDFTELILGEYSVYSLHADHRIHLFNKAAKYSLIEISLEDDDDDIDDYGDLFSPVK